MKLRCLSYETTLATNASLPAVSQGMDVPIARLWFRMALLLREFARHVHSIMTENAAFVVLGPAFLGGFLSERFFARSLSLLPVAPQVTCVPSYLWEGIVMRPLLGRLPLGY